MVETSSNRAKVGKCKQKE
ncbi:hypothetical protein CDAR_283751, partial [Caerostris darwini]